MAFVRKSRWYLTTAIAATAGFGAPAAAQDFYLGEVMKLANTFCPLGTVPADGRLLSIANESALYALYGTTYGGDGVTTFGVPDVRGRYTMHTGNGLGLTPRTLGQTGGTEANTMTLATMPKHEHIALLKASSAAGTSTTPVGNAFGTTPANKYITGTTPASQLMERGTIVLGQTGGNQSYDHRPPYLAIQYCVLTTGIFPSRN